MGIVIAAAGVVAVLISGGLYSAGVVSALGAVGVFYGLGDGMVLAAAGLAACRSRRS